MSQAEIWKFPLSLTSQTQKISMPKGTRIIAVHDQRGLPTIWAIVSPSAELIVRYFCIRGTGHEVAAPQNGYLGSCFAVDSFVWHVFET